jgi:phage shock protein A
MEDWKERLKAEYTQLKERYEKLKAYNIKLEVKANIAKTAPKDEEFYCNRLLARQQEIMEDYLKVLELRAELAHIEL